MLKEEKRKAQTVAAHPHLLQYQTPQEIHRPQS